MSDINLKIRQIIIDKLGVDEAIITNKADFYDDLGVDSLDFCEVIADIEKAFNLTIPDDMYPKFKNIDSLVNYVTQQKKTTMQKSMA